MLFDHDDVTWDSSKGESFRKQEREDDTWSLKKSRRSCRYLQKKTIDFVLV
jgi:hypothetical protein